MSVTPVTAILEMPKIKIIDFWNGKREFHNTASSYVEWL